MRVITYTAMRTEQKSHIEVQIIGNLIDSFISLSYSHSLHDSNLSLGKYKSLQVRAIQNKVTTVEHMNAKDYCSFKRGKLNVN